MNKLGSLNLAVKDLDAAIAFYGALFDFRELTDYRDEHFRVLDANGILLGFNDSVSAAPYGGFATGGVLIAFDVATPADVERVCQKAVESGGAVKQPPHETKFGAIGALLTDPEGHIFRILAWIKPPV